MVNISGICSPLRRRLLAAYAAGLEHAFAVAGAGAGAAVGDIVLAPAPLQCVKHSIMGLGYLSTPHATTFKLRIFTFKLRISRNGRNGRVIHTTYA